MPAKAKVKGKKKGRKLVVEGRVYIHSTFNNTIVTITDVRGNVIACGSSGTAKFKGSRKGTPYAAHLAAQETVQKAMSSGLKTVEVFIKGPGSGRETAIRALGAAGLIVTSIRDVTPMPHNGCRAPKKRRV